MIKEKKKWIIQWVNYMIKGLTIIMMNIINYQMLKNNYKKKIQAYIEDYDYDGWFTEEDLDDCHH